MSKTNTGSYCDTRKKLFEELISEGKDITIRRMLQRIVDEQVNRINIPVTKHEGYVKELEEAEKEKQPVSER